MRTIFLIEEDDETRRPLVENPRGAVYRVLVYLGGGAIASIGYRHTVRCKIRAMISSPPEFSGHLVGPRAVCRLHN